MLIICILTVQSHCSLTGINPEPGTTIQGRDDYNVKVHGHPARLPVDMVHVKTELKKTLYIEKILLQLEVGISPIKLCCRQPRCLYNWKDVLIRNDGNSNRSQEQTPKVSLYLSYYVLYMYCGSQGM